MQSYDDKDKIRPKNPPGVDNRSEKKANNKSKRTLSKRGKTAIALSLVSSAILASIGFEVILNNNYVATHQSNPSIPNSELALVALDDEQIYSSFKHENQQDDITIIEFLTRQNALKGQKIAALTEELDETKSRLMQLKTDILIRGGDKEKHYKTRIFDLEEQLVKADTGIQHLQAELAARNRLIDTKRSELDTLSKTFNETNDILEKSLTELEVTLKEEQKLTQTLNAENIALRTELEQIDAVFENEREAINKLIAAFSESHSIDLKKSAPTEESLADIFHEISSHLSDLEDKLYAAEESGAHASEQKLLIAMSEQNSLKEVIHQLEVEMEKYKTLYNQAITKNVDSESEKHRNALSFLERKLSSSDETSNIRPIENNNSNRRFHNTRSLSTSQQEKLIKDLERSLAAVEKENKELQKQYYNRSHATITTSDSDMHQDLANKLQEQLDAAEMRAFQLEQALASAKNNNQSDEIANLKVELENSKEALEKTKQHLNSMDVDYVTLQKKFTEEKDKNNNLLKQIASNTDIPIRQNSMSETGTVLSALKNRNMHLEEMLSQSTEEVSSLREIQLQLQKELSQLQAQSTSKGRVPSIAGNQMSGSDSDYQDRITLLEEALEIQKETLLAAQEELLRIEDEKESFDKNYQEMEVYFNGKIQELAQKNKSLEETLIANQELVREQSNHIAEDLGVNYDIEALKEQLAEAWLKYDEEHEHANALNEKLETAISRAEALEEEVTAISATKNASPATETAMNDVAYERLKSKISYLTSRLSQAKSKVKNSESRLKEMSVSQKEMLQRNKALEERLNSVGQGAKKARSGIWK